MCLLKTTEVGLGHRRQGQGGPRAGGEGIPRHRLQEPIPEGEPEAALPRPQEEPSSKSGQHLPPERTGQVQGVQQGALRPGRQEREVRLLRLPVPPQAGHWRLRRPQAQRPALRGEGRREDSGERAHRVQHQGVGEDGGRGDGRGGQGAAAEAGDHRGGACRREAKAGTTLRPGGDHRPGHRRLQAQDTRAPGAAGEARSHGGGGEDHPLPAQGGPGRRGNHHGLRPGHEHVPERERAHGAQGFHRELREGDRRHAR